MRISRKVRITEALLLGGLFFFSGCVSSSSKPRLSADAQAEALSHFSLGLLAEAGGDSVAAFDHLESAIRLDPSEERLYAPAVAVALELQRTNDALRLSRQLIQRNPGTIEPQLLLARVYALTGKMDSAEKLFRKIQTDCPDNPSAALFLARVYLIQSRPAEAMDTLRTAIAQDGGNAEILHLMGTLCVDQARNLGDTPEAQESIRRGIGFLRRALDLMPEEPLRWQQLGLALIAVKQPEDALNAFQEARLYAPSDLPLARQTLDLLIETKKYDDAMSLYEKLAEDTQTEPEIWLQYLVENIPEMELVRLAEYLEKHICEQPRAAVFYYAQLGSLYIGMHKNQEAEAILLKALVYYPDDNRLRIVLGYLHLQQERYEDAYTELNGVRTKSPEAEWSSNPFFLFNFLVSAQKSGHMEEAAQTLATTYTNSPVVLNQYMNSLLIDRTAVSTESAIELLNAFHTLSPKAAEALYYMMVFQSEQKEYQQALETARQLEKLAQTGGQTNLLGGSFYYQYGALYERTGQPEPAEKFFFKAIELGEETTAAAAQNYIAYMWADRGEKLELSLDLIQKALSVDPNNGAFLDTLGWIYYMQGRYDEALNQLQKSLSVIQDDPTVWEHLGDTFLKLGNRDEASKHWKKALELDPGSQRLQERLKENGVKPDEPPKAADIPADTTLRP
jgi:tetratricopeptide (TPR) repeat protein